MFELEVPYLEIVVTRHKIRKHPVITSLCQTLHSLAPTANQNKTLITLQKPANHVIAYLTVPQIHLQQEKFLNPLKRWALNRFVVILKLSKYLTINCMNYFVTTVTSEFFSQQLKNIVSLLNQLFQSLKTHTCMLISQNFIYIMLS